MGNDKNLTYAQLLLPLGHGYALFDPDPCGQYDRVRPGDVGYISKGRFYRAFNVFHSARDPINARGVPDGFKELKKEIGRRAPLYNNKFFSRDVNILGFEIGASSYA